MPRTISVLVAAVCAVLLSSWTTSAPPTLGFHHDVPGDLRALARGIWGDFLASFLAHADCAGGATLVADADLPDRAEYLPQRAEIRVDVPATATQLSEALVHEFAHHLETNCPAHRELRPRFLDAQGLPPDASWSEGPTWETTPSEQWAEAVVEVVLGRRIANRRVFITAESHDLVAAWGRGR